MKEKMKVYVQGEVIIKQIEALPDDLPEENKAGIAGYGETGNAHVLTGGKFKLYGAAKAAQKYLKVVEKTELRHGHRETTEGHYPAVIEPGVYEVYPQREVDIIERKWRNVID